MADTFEVDVQRDEAYRFEVSFPGKSYDRLTLDEPEPLGEDAGPNAARLLGAAIGNCLSASLVFCLKDSEIPLEDVRAHVVGELVRNEDNRLRIGHLEATIDVDTPVPHADAIQGCLDTFEEFCVVTGSVRQGIDIDVEVNLHEVEQEDPMHGDLDTAI